MYGNVSRLFEAPTTFEMQDDMRGGDAMLDPMKGTVAEVGWRSRAKPSAGTRWTWDVAAYYARIGDEILSLDDPNAPGNSLTTNVEKTTHAGLEALLGAASRSAWTSRRSSGQRHAQPLPVRRRSRLRRQPPARGTTYVARGEILYRHARGVYAGPTFDFVGERFVDFASTYAVDSYALLGLRAGFTGRRFEVFGELRNLLDEENVATLGVLNVAAPDARVLYPGAPLSAYVGARVSF